MGTTRILAILILIMLLTSLCMMLFGQITNVAYDTNTKDDNIFVKTQQDVDFGTIK